ncbi:hypothetical protein QP185_17905 [Sphingomonas aerolata]|nr:MULTISPECIES: hypothetical protein [Sphingomonas]MBB3589128.1 hypothetical protein [Sphingomonas sp. BK481]MBD8733969.1 hypothetical protein [Sphingomonas sp. CFBP 13706]
MTIVEARRLFVSEPMVDTLLQIVGPEAEIGDWARVAAAVDTINNGRMH